MYGAEPEVQAYAMAKYSRSALSLHESLRESSTSRRRRNFSIPSIFSTDTAHSRSWRTSPSPLRGFRSSATIAVRG